MILIPYLGVLSLRGGYSALNTLNMRKIKNCLAPPLKSDKRNLCFLKPVLLFLKESPYKNVRIVSKHFGWKTASNCSQNGVRFYRSPPTSIREFDILWFPLFLLFVVANKSIKQLCSLLMKVKCQYLPFLHYLERSLVLRH